MSLLAAGVGILHVGDDQVGERDWCTAMLLFADEIEFRGGRVAIEAGLLQRRIEHLVSAVQDLGAFCNLQRKKLPAIAIRKGCPIEVLYPCFSDFRHVEQASEGFRGYNNGVS